MAKLMPFRALRPMPDVAASIAAVPYDVVNTDEARALAAANPSSFLHTSRAEIDLAPGADPYSDAVYDRAAENFRALRERALVVEDEPSVYFYQLRMGGHVQTGIAASFSLDEYDRDVIKKHERTRRDKEDDRTRHILRLRAQTGPVFLTYKKSTAVDAVVTRTSAGGAMFDFTAADGIQHTLWRVAAADEHELIAAFERIPSLYIADGHHRAASAARVRRHLHEQTGGAGEWDTFLAVAFPDDQMQVLPYNRVIKDLAAYSPESLLAAIRAQFNVEEGPASPVRRGDVAMYLAGRWHTIRLGDAPSDLAADA